MNAQAIQSVAKNKEIIPCCVEKGFYAKVVSRAKEALSRNVPYRKSEIAPQSLEAVFAPCGIRLKRINSESGALISHS